MIHALKDGWTERPQLDEDDRLSDLCREAALALYVEDQGLRAATYGMASKSYKNEPRGLTYWLYETTIVYFIFRAWARRWYVKWDWEPISGIKSRKDGRHMDLCVEIGDEHYGFEAKWWNTDKAREPANRDAARLRTWIGQDQSKKGFLLAFWWSDGDENHNKWLEEEWRPHKLVYRASFPTLGPDEKPRRFFLDCYEVR